MMRATCVVLLVVATISVCFAAVAAPLTSNQKYDISLLRKHASTVPLDSNDLKALNYALTLEHLVATFYTEGMQNDCGREQFGIHSTGISTNTSVFKELCS